jgi:putative transposase
VEIEVLRDRNGTYDPKIIPKHERRFTGFDQKILSSPLRKGMSRGELSSSMSRQQASSNSAVRGMGYTSGGSGYRFHGV